MTDERWERNLADAARGFNDPPPAPRDRMWQRLQERRQPRPAATAPPALPSRRSRWWAWPAAVAAALLVGVLIGRQDRPLVPRTTPGALEMAAHTEQPVGERTAASSPSDQADPAVMRAAARPVLARAETLLLQVATGSESDPESFGARAVGLLGQTRLLLGSPLAEDPELRALLLDLELSLARIVRLGAEPGAVALPELREGLQRKAVLTRLRDQL
jgi:hypothetical protein